MQHEGAAPADGRDHYAYTMDAFAVAQMVGSDARWVVTHLHVLAIDLEALAYEAARRAAEQTIGSAPSAAPAVARILRDPGRPHTYSQRVRRLRWRRLDLVESIRRLQQGAVTA